MPLRLNLQLFKLLESFLQLLSLLKGLQLY